MDENSIEIHHEETNMAFDEVLKAVNLMRQQRVLPTVDGNYIIYANGETGHVTVKKHHMMKYISGKIARANDTWGKWTKVGYKRKEKRWEKISARKNKKPV